MKLSEISLSFFPEAYYQKGWKAYVEKKEVPIYKVNFSASWPLASRVC